MNRTLRNITIGQMLMKSIYRATTSQPRHFFEVTMRRRRYQYTLAIARQLPDSFPNAVSMDEKSDNPSTTIDMDRARKQHRKYLKALRQVLPVLELPVAVRSVPSSSTSMTLHDTASNLGRSDDEPVDETSKKPSSANKNDGSIDSNSVLSNEYPDCAFVEDTVIAIGKYALITRMGHTSRRGEGDSVSTALLQLGMEVLNMNDYHNATDWIYGRGKRNVTGGTVDTSPVIDGDLATVDGGDVLYTERHIYVGLSDRTNIEGAMFIRQFFSSYDVIVVPQISLDPNTKLTHPIPLHLKSAVTHIDSYTLLLPTGPYGDYLVEAMNVEEFAYKVHRVPDLLSCNVISCNGHVIVQDTLCKRSQEILFDAVMESDQDLVRVDTSELAKKDAALTCCSVLLEV